MAPATKQKTMAPELLQIQKIIADRAMIMIIDTLLEFSLKYYIKLRTITPAVAALNPKNANFTCVTFKSLAYTSTKVPKINKKIQQGMLNTMKEINPANGDCNFNVVTVMIIW